MKIREIITEGLKRDKAEQIIDSFIRFASKELELNELPEINILDDSQYSVEYRSFGGYSPSDKIINITVKNRHINDVLRTIAHEIVHYKQDINGELKPDSGRDGSPEENEANARAAVTMRKWGKLHPELFGRPAVE